MSTKFILIDIRDPEQFIDGANGIKKKFMLSSYKTYGTPTSISSTALNCDFDELLKIITARLNKSTQDHN
jgi:hypothetical protein